MALSEENVLVAEQKLIAAIRVITKAMDLESHRRGDMVVKSLAPTFEHIQVFGDTATVGVVYGTEGEMTGRPIRGRFRYFRAWRDSGSGLQVIGGACHMLG